MCSAFAQCKHLQHLSLPHKLRRIEQEAFLKCTSLKEVSVPPTLLHIARRAFAGCAQLCQFHRVRKSVTWRGTYSRANAFLKCDNLDTPKWVRLLPLNRQDEDNWTDDSCAEPRPCFTYFHVVHGALHVLADLDRLLERIVAMRLTATFLM